MKRITAVIFVLTSLGLVACAESGPTDEERQAAEDARAKATKLTRQAESATALAANCREAIRPLIEALRDTGSRLNVGLSFADYSDQVGEISIAYDRVPFKRMDFECISGPGIKAEKAFNNYSDAYTQWNDCIGDLHCDMDSIDSNLQSEWSAAGRQTRQARAALSDLESQSAEAEDRAEQQDKKADEAEAALEA